MSTAQIIPASALRPGLATIIVSLPDRTIRSCVFMVQAHPHGVVQVAFTSGEMLTLSTRTMVGRNEPAPRRPDDRRTEPLKNHARIIEAVFTSRDILSLLVDRIEPAASPRPRAPARRGS